MNIFINWNFKNIWKDWHVMLLVCDLKLSFAFELSSTLLDKEVFSVPGTSNICVGKGDNIKLLCCNEC